jgi:hypothetical protein
MCNYQSSTPPHSSVSLRAHPQLTSIEDDAMVELLEVIDQVLEILASNDSRSSGDLLLMEEHPPPQQ